MQITLNNAQKNIEASNDQILFMSFSNLIGAMQSGRVGFKREENCGRGM